MNSEEGWKAILWQYWPYLYTAREHVRMDFAHIYPDTLRELPTKCIVICSQRVCGRRGHYRSNCERQVHDHIPIG